MQLIGSLASPYVRRLRILLEELNCPFEFIEIKVFSEEGQKELAKYTKTKRVPILIDEEKIIWDSLLMTKYLLHKFNKPEITLEEDKEINLINEANDSAIVIYQLKYFDLDPDYQNTYSQIQFSRLKGILTYFNDKLETQSMGWNTKANFLYCLLDWLIFRNIYEWQGKYLALDKFYSELKSKPILQNTAPR